MEHRDLVLGLTVDKLTKNRLMAALGASVSPNELRNWGRWKYVQIISFLFDEFFPHK